MTRLVQWIAIPCRIQPHHFPSAIFLPPTIFYPNTRIDSRWAVQIFVFQQSDLFYKLFSPSVIFPVTVVPTEAFVVTPTNSRNWDYPHSMLLYRSGQVRVKRDTCTLQSERYLIFTDVLAQFAEYTSPLKRSQSRQKGTLKWRLLCLRTAFLCLREISTEWMAGRMEQRTNKPWKPTSAASLKHTGTWLPFFPVICSRHFCSFVVSLLSPFH